MGKSGRVVSIIVILAILVLSLSIIGAKGDSTNKIDKKVLDEVAKEGKVRVIVKLKESDKSNSANNLRSVSAKESIRNGVTNKIDKNKIGYEFSSSNSFSASLSSEDILILSQDPNVENIYFDIPVHIDLQDSVPLINATETWSLQNVGINFTGRGQTICIIDTGVDYTHPDLGNCTPIREEINGTIENLTSPVESAHNYVDDTDITWNITKSGYSQIGIHFVNMSTESTYDYIYILNGDGNIVGTYSGTMTDFWSPSVEGDTIYVRLKSDASVTDYGFYIDQTINGTTNKTYDWDNCSKIIGGWDVSNSDPDPQDDNGHGTHVTGIAAANGTIKGVAPEAKIISIKALNASGDGFSGEIAAGIEWCTNRSEDYNISVISMSLGGGLYTSYCDSNDTTVALAINAAVAKNISVVVAAGNNGNSAQISSPACIQNATPVGSTNKTDAISSFSNRNSLVQLFAPGTSINSTVPTGSCEDCASTGYKILQGTSMATPHVAGAYALINQYLESVGETRTPQQIESAFNSSGKVIYDSSSGLNYSRINVYAAVMTLDDSAPNVTLVNPSTDIVNTTALNLNLTFNCNATDFYLTNITFYLWNLTGVYNESTFQFNGDKNGTIEVNLTNIPQGDYKWNCLARDNDNNAAFASSNRSIIYNLAQPVITLSSPADEFSTSSSVSFEYNVYSNVSMENCSLIVNDSVVSYNSSAVILSSTNTITQTLSVGSYNWSINCTDVSDKTSNSSSRSITITSPPASSSGGGGGGGSSTTTVKNYTVSNTELANGYSASLSKNDKMKFIINSEAHILTLNNIGPNYVNITLESDPIELRLVVGESLKINLTSSNYYDLLIRLNSIIGTRANITITGINEIIEKPSSTIDDNISMENKSKGQAYTIQDSESSSVNSGKKTGIIIVMIAILLFLIIYFYRQYEASIRHIMLKKHILN